MKIRITKDLILENTFKGYFLYVNGDGVVIVFITSMY